ncbi:glycosyl hydrolase [Rhodococcus pyridinivorans]|uniref:glycosyl hydrolase n=1 Tax=Rhodococcus pyridinivorans TaxID=103816 RepID=UPI00342D8AF2
MAEGNGRWARRWDRFRPFLVPAMIVVAVAGWGTVDLVRDVERRNHAHPPAGPACVSAQVPPEGPGVWWGVNLDFDRKTLAQYASDLGHRPAVTVTFTDLPYTEAQRADLVRAVEQVRADGQILLLTLEPFGGLETVTEQVARQVAADLAEFNAAGVPVIVRLAHEMNGSWYPWGHQPAAYVEMFRTVAAAVHERAPGSAMMWAPNYGGGYPFGGGQFEAAPGSAASSAP